MNPLEHARSHWRTVVGKTLWWAAEKYAYPDIIVSDETRENTMALGAHLDRGGSALVIPNHLSGDDIPLEQAYLIDALGTSIQRLTAPVGKKQFDGREGFFNAAVLHALPYIGVERPLLVQGYDTGKYDQELTKRLRDLAFYITNRTLHTPGGLLMYPPEGTRSKDGKLQRARLGVGHVIIDYLLNSTSESPPAIIVPAAIIPTGKFSRSFNWKYSKRPLDPLEIRIGQGVPMDQLSYNFNPREITADCMQLLKGMMPSHMHGFYASK